MSMLGTGAAAPAASPKPRATRVPKATSATLGVAVGTSEPVTGPEPAAAPIVAAAPVFAAPVVTPAPAPVSSAAPVASAAPTPPPPSDIAGPADTGPGAPGAPAPTRRSTPDVAAAVDKAIDRLREHLTVGEIVAGAGSLIILVIAWGVFGFLFDHKGALPGQVVMIVSAALLAALVLQNAKVHDFGPSYRLIVTGLAMTLGFLAVVEILQQLRWAFGGRNFDLGGLTWWAGAIVAVIGGWMVWREPRRDA